MAGRLTSVQLRFVDGDEPWELLDRSAMGFDAKRAAAATAALISEQAPESPPSE